jgi:hypothetical protein
MVAPWSRGSNPDHDEDNNELSPFIGDLASVSHGLTFQRHVLPWIISTIAFALISVALISRQWITISSGNFESGFATEIGMKPL